MASMDPFGWVFVPRMKDAITIDVSAKPIVFCKECNQWDEESGMMGRGWCGWQMKCTGPNYFCADGEKEGEEEDGE